MRWGGWVLVLTLTLATHHAAAELYRCVAPDGSLRFTGNPADCPGAEPYVPRRELQRPDAAPPAAEGEVPPPAARHPARTVGHDALLTMFPPAATGWEIVEEAKTDPRGDPDLWDNGVRAMAARHYTRALGATSQACSVEIWAFSGIETARAAQQLLGMPDWTLHREENILILLHAVTLERGRGSRPGIMPACAQIGEQARELVAAGSR